MAKIINNRRAYPSAVDEKRAAYREERDRVRSDVARFTAQLRAATALGMPLVYGVLRPESPVVKIGTSTRLPSKASWTGRLARFGGIDVVRLVALMHGGYAEERQVHTRLAASRVKMDDLPGTGVTEHFLITDEVIEWINETRNIIGLDPVTADELLAYSA